MRKGEFAPNNGPPGRTVGTGWPSVRYGPDGQSQVFKREEDVPPGWQDHPAAQFVPPAPPAPPPMERKAVIEALKARGIGFRYNAATSALYEQLKASGYDHGNGDR
jgi:hypothetical protein